MDHSPEHGNNLDTHHSTQTAMGLSDDDVDLCLLIQKQSCSLMYGKKSSDKKHNPIYAELKITNHIHTDTQKFLTWLVFCSLFSNLLDKSKKDQLFAY